MNIKNIFRNKKRRNPIKSPNINNSKGENMSKHTDMLVKVGRSGSAVIEVALNGKHTVADALTAAGLNLKASEQIRVNKDVVDEDYELSDGDVVFLAKHIAGGLR